MSIKHHKRRIAELLEEYTNLLQQGKAPSIEVFCKRHEEYAFKLRPLIKGLGILHVVFQDIYAAVPEKKKKEAWERLKSRFLTDPPKSEATESP